MRFLGIFDREVKKITPSYDEAKPWSPLAEEAKPTIEKRYRTLGFPKMYDNEFYRALDEIAISDAISPESYDRKSVDGKRNLLSYPYLCEGSYARSRARGVPDDIIVDTFRDLVVWTTEWTNIKGSLALGELTRLWRHMSGVLFRLGRL